MWGFRMVGWGTGWLGLFPSIAVLGPNADPLGDGNKKKDAYT